MFFRKRIFNLYLFFTHYFFLSKLKQLKCDSILNFKINEIEDNQESEDSEIHSKKPNQAKDKNKNTEKNEGFNLNDGNANKINLRDRSKLKPLLMGNSESDEDFGFDDMRDSAIISSDTNDCNDSSENIKNLCSGDEYIRLVYIVDKIGENWKMIAKDYKKYFKNRNSDDLEKMYKCLVKYDLFEGLKKKSELIKDIKIIRYKKKYTYWTYEEIIYLVLGVMKFGRNWHRISTTYRNHFSKNRTESDFCSKYKYLEKDQKMLKYYKKKAYLLFQNKK